MPMWTSFQQLYEWDTSIYSFSGILKGHHGPINALAFNNSGSLLASGGDDEQVRIWDISTFRQRQHLMNAQSRWGQITCLQFINFEIPLSADWLCFGTGRGMVVLYRKSRKAAEFTEIWSSPVFPAGDSVESLTFDSGHQRLAASSHYGQIKVLRYQNGKFTELWGEVLRDAIPRALLFADNGRILNTFALETGAIISRDAETSTIIITRHLNTAIGHVNQCQTTGNLIVDNMQDGFNLYPPNRVIPMRTYRIEVSRMYVKAAVFCEGGKMIAGGSDHGRVYVFAYGGEQVKQELMHGKKQDLIQAVEATTANNFHVIVSGGNHDIYVWKKPIKGRVSRERRQMLESLVAMNIIFLIGFLWMTRDAWSQNLKAGYVKIFNGMVLPFPPRG